MIASTAVSKNCNLRKNKFPLPEILKIKQTVQYHSTVQQQHRQLSSTPYGQPWPSLADTNVRRTKPAITSRISVCKNGYIVCARGEGGGRIPSCLSSYVGHGSIYRTVPFRKFAFGRWTGSHVLHWRDDTRQTYGRVGVNHV